MRAEVEGAALDVHGAGGRVGVVIADLGDGRDSDLSHAQGDGEDAGGLTVGGQLRVDSCRGLGVPLRASRAGTSVLRYRSCSQAAACMAGMW